MNTCYSRKCELGGSHRSHCSTRWCSVLLRVPDVHRFELEGNTILEQTVTCDKMWVHYFTPESKQSSMEWCHTGSPPPKKFKTQLSVDKIMASVFWDSGVSHVDFLPRVTTINA
jgi:hypothetical protein